MKNKVKKLKSSLEFLRHDIEDLENRLERMEIKNHNKKKLQMQVFRGFITMLLIVCSLAYLYSIYTNG